MVLETNNIDDLVTRIEIARRKLNKAVENGLEEENCHLLSRELDELIERYIDLKEVTGSSEKTNN